MKGFTIYGHGGHLGHVTQMLQTNFRSPYPRRLHIHTIFGLIGQAVSEEKVFENVNGRRTDAGPWVYNKLTYEPSAKVS